MTNANLLLLLFQRFKKTPGPEFETEDILKSEPEKCVSCSLTAQANKHGQPEELLVCKDCNTTGKNSFFKMHCSDKVVYKTRLYWFCLVWFYTGYLIPNPVYICILDIYDL